MIPMVDVQAQHQDLKQEIEAALLQALEEAKFILGPNTQAFEQEVADYLGARYAVGVASGTDALHLALLAAGIGPGDEVITSPFTFIATAEAIRYVGAVPRFVDIDPKTFNIDINQMAEAIGPKTRALLPVHLFGQPVDMAALISLAKENNLTVIEDCAQSFGARIGEKTTGTFGHYGCFSFFPSKNLGGYGDGGLIATDSEAGADHLRALRNHGMKIRYQHNEIGYNSRLDELQAVVLRIKLAHIDRYNRERYRVAQSYRQRLGDSAITLPYEDGIGHHSYHQYTALSVQRDAILAALQRANIGCAIYYPIPLHKQAVFAQEYVHLSLPISEKIATLCFSLPIFPELQEEQIETITKVVLGVL